MHESFTCTGEWWMPTASDDTEPQKTQPSTGSLKWDEHGATLELHPALTPLRGVIYADDAVSSKETTLNRRNWEVDHCLYKYSLGAHP